MKALTDPTFTLSPDAAANCVTNIGAERLCDTLSNVCQVLVRANGASELSDILSLQTDEEVSGVDAAEAMRTALCDCMVPSVDAAIRDGYARMTAFLQEELRQEQERLTEQERLAKAAALRAAKPSRRQKMAPNATMRSLREAKKRSDGRHVRLEEVAVAVGVCESSIRNWEYGRVSNIEFRSALQLANYYGVSAEDLALALDNSIRLNQNDPQNPVVPGRRRRNRIA